MQQRGVITHTEVMRLLQLLADENRMTSVSKLSHLYWLLSGCIERDVPGAVVELGCNQGLTSVFLQATTAVHGQPRDLHVFDSFEGLPRPTPQDTLRGIPLLSADGNSRRVSLQGKMKVGTGLLRDNFDRFGMSQPVVHQGFFEQTLPQEIPPVIAFALLDSDFYESILLSLQSVYPRMSPGGVVVIDDYCRPDLVPDAWPGFLAVAHATDGFFRPLGIEVVPLIGRHRDFSTSKKNGLAMAFARIP